MALLRPGSAQLFTSGDQSSEEREVNLSPGWGNHSTAQSLFGIGDESKVFRKASVLRRFLSGRYRARTCDLQRVMRTRELERLELTIDFKGITCGKRLQEYRGFGWVFVGKRTNVPTIFGRHSET